MLRCAISPSAPLISRAVWTGVTHLGSAQLSLLAAGMPWIACCALRRVAYLALPALALSHLLVQAVKRSVGRGRPSCRGGISAIVREPDRFSFPSGHATAGMVIALSYAVVFPLWAGPLLLLGALVGFSRVRLGVHYPSDVLAGQLLAVVTVTLVARVQSSLLA